MKRSDSRPTTVTMLHKAVRLGLRRSTRRTWFSLALHGAASWTHMRMRWKWISGLICDHCQSTTYGDRALVHISSVGLATSLDQNIYTRDGRHTRWKYWIASPCSVLRRKPMRRPAVMLNRLLRLTCCWVETTYDKDVRWTLLHSTTDVTSPSSPAAAAAGHVTCDVIIGCSRRGISRSLVYTVNARVLVVLRLTCYSCL